MKLSDLDPATQARVKAQMPKVPKKPRRGQMNRTEAEYAGMLALLKEQGLVLDYGFEQVKLRLARGAWFCPDFWALHPNAAFELIEIKGGHIREASMVRIKVAAETYKAFVFTLAQRVDGEWSSRRIGGP